MINEYLTLSVCLERTGLHFSTYISTAPILMSGKLSQVTTHVCSYGHYMSYIRVDEFKLVFNRFIVEAFYLIYISDFDHLLTHLCMVLLIYLFNIIVCMDSCTYVSSIVHNKNSPLNSFTIVNFNLNFIVL